MMREGVALTWTGGSRKHRKSTQDASSAGPDALGGFPASHWHTPGGALRAAWCGWSAAGKHACVV